MHNKLSLSICHTVERTFTVAVIFGIGIPLLLVAAVCIAAVLAIYMWRRKRTYNSIIEGLSHG